MKKRAAYSIIVLILVCFFPLSAVGEGPLSQPRWSFYPSNQQSSYSIPFSSGFGQFQQGPGYEVYQCQTNSSVLFYTAHPCNAVSNTSSAEYVTISPQLKIHIPQLEFLTPLGAAIFSVDLVYVEENGEAPKWVLESSTHLGLVDGSFNNILDENLDLTISHAQFTNAENQTADMWVNLASAGLDNSGHPQWRLSGAGIYQTPSDFVAISNPLNGSISYDTVKMEDSYFQWVVDHFDEFKSSDISFTVPNVAEQGVVVPVTVDIVNGHNYGKGKMWFFVDNNPSPTAGLVEFHRNESRFHVSTRLKMADSGYIYVAYIADNGEIAINRRYISVGNTGVFDDYCLQDASSGNWDCGDANFKLTEILVRAEQAGGITTIKALMRDKMLPNDAITRVEAYINYNLVATARFTVNMSYNPYFSVKTALTGTQARIIASTINGSRLNVANEIE